MKKIWLFVLVCLPMFASLNAYPYVAAQTIKSQNKPDLVLYYSPSCPYCKKVLNYLDSIHKTVPMKNTVQNSEYRSELIKIGGKSQVPCLVIDGKALYESDDIIKWLSEHTDLLQNS